MEKTTKTQKKPPTQQQQQQQQQGSTKVVEKRKRVFVKVDQLKPGTKGHNVLIKSETVVPKGRPAASPNLRQTRIAQCLASDETATLVFTACNDQVNLMKPETTVISRNAKIDMFKGSMRLAVDKWGCMEVTELANFVVKDVRVGALEPINCCKIDYL